MSKIFATNKPKNITNKTKTSIFTLILLLVMSSISLMFAPTVNAQALPTHAYVAVSPDPAGINQEVTILMWMIELSPVAAGPYGHWANYTLQITKPDGNTQNFGPLYSDPTGYAYVIYTPDQLGTYTLKFNFPGQHVSGTHALFGIPYAADYAASSYTTTFIVQEEPATASPQMPLPTDYWTRPIDAQNQDWYTISGNWFGTGYGRYGFGTSTYNGTGDYNPYTTSPKSSHIIWTKSLRFGGLIGGEYGNSPTSSYYTGKTYEMAFVPPVIINGVLYYNERAPPNDGFYAVDLRTGETLWRQTVGSLASQQSTSSGTTSSAVSFSAQITFGQVYNYLSPNQIGGIPYLWATGGSTWTMYDAFTGELILQFANATATAASSNNIVEGPNGEILMYLAGASWVAMWNSSLCIGNLGPTGTNAWQWRPQPGSTLDWKRGIQWNATTPAYPGQNILAISGNVILATTGSPFLASPWQMEMGYDATTGEQLWAKNRTVSVSDVTLGWMGPMADGVYTAYHRTTMQWYGYSIYTGDLVWGPIEQGTNPWGTIMTYESSSADGVLYAVAVDGVHAFDMTTGEKLWDFYADPSGTDFGGFNTYPFEGWGSPPTIADGTAFAATGNSHGVALYRGAELYAIDTDSGEKIWDINGFYEGTMPIADGILVAYNGYDNQIYAFGKGPSATTVEAPMTAITLGDKVVIRGTVTDQSAGTEQLELAARFPNGVPAIADEYMSAWMEYLYMQQSCPQMFNGVKVKLETLDPNGNFYEIGTVTSDASGMYKLLWEPPVPGEYTIIATFAGSESYFSSYAETAIGVTKASTAGGQIEPEPTEAPLLSTEMAIIIAAVIVALAVILGFFILRKRK
jgi:hypothetical protein